MDLKYKRKIINDPVYGFIDIPYALVFEIIEHPYFQRLTRIKQLGLTHMVYPGAQHTRFQHSMGALHLMTSCISTLREKGINISQNEAEAVSIAILLHDIGHGPFSHALEQSLIEGISHEDLSGLFMEELNEEFSGKLELAIRIFNNQYDKKFLHQLVSGQLDMDRLDYLRRDSFFTGVSEGTIGSDRIIKMMNVVDDNLVIDVKGIYSLEKFLIARRLMYWQVYLHKTVQSAEFLLVKTLRRAIELAQKGVEVYGTPALKFFLYQNINQSSVFSKKTIWKTGGIMNNFALLDDSDIISSAKVWAEGKDKVLCLLSRRLINRELFKVELSDVPFSGKAIQQIRNWVVNEYNVEKEHAQYFVFSEMISNYAFDPTDHNVQVLNKDGSLHDIGEVSDILNTRVLSKKVRKYCLCYPKKYNHSL
ncbi:MAG: HD domain-containing protein [Bacteroidales bacterium]|nr:HD domain-containing protein [Bacteroidales bacterium]